MNNHCEKIYLRVHICKSERHLHQDVTKFYFFIYEEYLHGEVEKYGIDQNADPQYSFYL